MQFTLDWSANRQILIAGGHRFEGSGKGLMTDPSHDLVHLLIAASGGSLVWEPSGDRDSICFAEYNAVLLEQFLDKTFSALHYDPSRLHCSLAAAVSYMRWFVECHFAPFPVSSKEAYRRFCRGLNPEPIIRLSPYYYAQKRVERTTPNYRALCHRLTFDTADAPAADEIALAFQNSVRQQLALVCADADPLSVAK
jgi:hypothetical protein